MPRFVTRTYFYTQPGRRDEAVAKIRELQQIGQEIAPQEAARWKPRILSAALASPGQPDLIMEVESEDPQAFMRFNQQAWSNQRFLDWNKGFVPLLDQAAKTDLYMIEE